MNLRKDGIDVVQTGLAAAMVTLMVTVVGLLLSAASNLLKWYEIAAGGLVVILLIVSLSAFVIWFISRPALKRMDYMLEKIHIDKAVQGATWLITSDNLRDIESNTAAKNVWIITNSMEEEIEIDLFGDVVRGNLSRGVEYTYFIPDSPALLARVEKMKDVFGLRGLTFKAISSPLFDLICAQDTAIFGASGKGSKSMAGYMNLPIGEGGNSYFVVLGPRQCERIVGILSATSARVV